MIFILLGFIVTAIILVVLYVYKFNNPTDKDRIKHEDYFEITGITQSELDKDLGKQGEFNIYSKLKVYEEKGYKFLFNVYLPKETGETTELDVVMICDFGVMVFESKNYKGRIIGDEKSEKWTQLLENNDYVNSEIEFYNPILQNNAHIRYLQKYLGTSVPIYSVVVFSNKADITGVREKSKTVQVVNLRDIIKVVENVTKVTKLSQNDMSRVYKILYPFVKVSKKEKEKHIKDIEINKKLMEIAKEQRCPKCGSPLVARTATKGVYKGKKFFGCSNYPHCTFTQNIDISKI